MNTEPSARRAGLAALPSLVAMSSAFFMPMVPSCDRLESPLSFGLGGWGAALATWPMFVAAAVLAVMVVAHVRRTPGRVARWLPAPLVLATSISAIVAVYLFAMDPGAFPVAAEVGLIAFAVGAQIVGMLAWIAGLRVDGWRGLAAMCVAWGAFSLPSLPSLMIGEALLANPRELGYGTWVYLASLAVIGPAMGAAGAWMDPVEDDE